MSIYPLKKCRARVKIIANTDWRQYMIYNRLTLDVFGRKLVLDTYLEEGAKGKDSVLVFPAEDTSHFLPSARVLPLLTHTMKEDLTHSFFTIR